MNGYDETYVFQLYSKLKYVKVEFSSINARRQIKKLINPLIIKPNKSYFSQ